MHRFIGDLALLFCVSVCSFPACRCCRMCLCRLLFLSLCIALVSMLCFLLLCVCLCLLKILRIRRGLCFAHDGGQPGEDGDRDQDDHAG